MIERSDKSDRALELREQGLSRTAIAERLGVPVARLDAMILWAKNRRKASTGIPADE